MRNFEILLPLAPLVDGYFDRIELLKSKGWFSFEPYWKFRRSLCTEDEWLFHEKFVREDFKQSLGYHSDFICELKKKLGVAEFNQPPTACDEKFWSLWYNGEKYDELWRPYRLEQMRLREKEIELHSRPVIQNRIEIDERQKRIGIWRDVVSEIGGRMGFLTKAKPTSRSTPVFRYQLNKQWQIAIGVDQVALGRETADTIAKPPSGVLLPIGSESTWMVLIQSGTAISSSNDKMFYIPQLFFPFDKAYDSFWDMQGLEINIRARMEALELIWPEMRPLLIECIGGF